MIIKLIKSKILINMMSVVLIGSVLIGVITAFMNAAGIDALMKKTIGPAAQMAASAVRWKIIGLRLKKLQKMIYFVFRTHISAAY